MKNKYIVENAEFGSRVKKVREALKIKQVDLAEKLKMAQGVLSEIESQKFNPGYGFLMKMFETFDVSPTYILTGIGPMFIKEDDDSFAFDEFGGYREEVKEVNSYLKKSPIVRLAVINFVKDFVHTSKFIVDMDIKLNLKQAKEGTGEPEAPKKDKK